MGHVAFGSYRISHRSQIHRKALIDALEKGCQLIDTSSNYTNGESEILIGEVLSQRPELQPQIVTKAGYIQGKTLESLEELHQKNLAKDDLVELSPNLKHSIHPEFLNHQLTQSLQRLKKQRVDYYLLHNPEYYFDQDPSQAQVSALEYYQRIE